MDTVKHSYLRDSLLTIVGQIDDAYTAEEFCLEDKPSINWVTYLPPMIQNKRGIESDAQTYARYLGRVASRGKDIYKLRRDGTIGTVDWEQTDAELSSTLNRQRIDELAGNLFRQLFTIGLAAAIAYQDARTGQHVISHLNGYLRLLLDPEDVSRVWGLYQVQKVTSEAKIRYNVNLYDFEQRTLSKWVGVNDPSRIFSTPPTETVENAPMPRYAYLEMDSNGNTKGEMQANAPLLIEDVVTQINQMRVMESHGFPVNVLTGNFQDVKAIGPNAILYGEQGDDFKRVPMGDLQPQFDYQDRLYERIRNAFALPVELFGGSSPSGEALRLLRKRFDSACATYAKTLSRLLSEVVADYAALLNRKPVVVTVQPNNDYQRDETIDRVIRLYETGLMPLEVAVQTIQPYFEMFTEDEVIKFIQGRANANANPDLIRQILNS